MQIESLRRRAEELTDSPVPFGESGDGPPEVEDTIGGAVSRRSLSIPPHRALW